jgi:hypothetical protein
MCVSVTIAATPGAVANMVQQIGGVRLLQLLIHDYLHSASHAQMARWIEPPIASWVAEFNYW